MAIKQEEERKLNEPELETGMFVQVFDDEIVGRFGYTPIGEIIEIDGEDVKIAISSSNDYQEYWNVNFRPVDVLSL